MKASLRILNPENHARRRKHNAYKKYPVHSSQANSVSGTTAFPDNVFFFIYSLLTPDSKSASREKQAGFTDMASGFLLPENVVQTNLNHQQGSVYKLQHGKIFSIFLLTPYAFQGKK
ncbi:hypothetical protein [Akkermansia muciniphila]|jgi:hypothetical protein|uniref:hypothetical protein n=1 Tax=Akkermansia muciniphila TaxID=239935 RepID=UPI0011AF2655|nr:hypothetical protein [Akkermansia muciniphila]